jgi:hypothetical protein
MRGDDPRAADPGDRRKNVYSSGAEWAHLAADVWTVTAAAARHGIEPLSLPTGYLQECARNGGTAPAGADLSTTRAEAEAAGG